MLGVGDMDDGIIYVAKLGEQEFGIGGFIDIVNSANKITFVGRKGKKKFNIQKVNGCVININITVMLNIC